MSGGGDMRNENDDGDLNKQVKRGLKHNNSGDSKQNGKMGDSNKMMMATFVNGKVQVKVCLGIERGSARLQSFQH